MKRYLEAKGWTYDPDSPLVHILLHSDRDLTPRPPTRFEKLVNEGFSAIEKKNLSRKQ